MNKEIRIIREINLQAERFYDEAQALGNHAYQAFKEEFNKHRSQLTGLENVAECSLKTSDIFDYIKKKIAGSDPGKEWQAKVREDPPTDESQKSFGERLKTCLEKISERVDVICKNAGVVPRGEKGKSKQDHEYRLMRQDIHVRLMREFIRQLVVQYEYRAGGGGE